MTMRTLTCGEFEHGLGDHLDGGASAAARASMDAHAATCGDCAALLAGVSSIVAEARSLPELAPSRDLWQGIEARIAAPVLALDTTARRGVASAPRRSASWLRMGAAAAALVVATAGITYMATRSMLDAGAPATVTATAAPAEGADSLLPAGHGENAEAGEPAAVVAGHGAPGAGRRAGTSRPGDVAATPVSAPAARPLAAGEETFDTEIGELRSVLERRRTELDPATVAILEHNLDVIDQAIEQSRAALVRDPANQFLTEQLNSTLGKKVELLRTAAMLPARL
jgi:anti-sigma factor RsiW